MYKSGRNIFVSHAEIIEIRKEGKAFLEFWALSEEWRKAMVVREAAKFPDMDRAAIRSCIDSGLIRAIRYLDPIRFPNLNAGSILTWAFRFYTKEAYSERPVMLSKEAQEADPCGVALLNAGTLEYSNDSGDTCTGDIPVNDEGIENMESKDFMSRIESQFNGRDLAIIRGIAKGQSFVEISDELNVSRQYVTKHFADKIKPRLARMMA